MNFGNTEINIDIHFNFGFQPWFYVRHVDVHMHVTSAEPKSTVDPDEHDGLEDADDEQRDGADDLVDERDYVDASLYYHLEGREGEDEDDQAEDNVTEAAFAEERSELLLYGAHDALDERELHTRVLLLIHEIFVYRVSCISIHETTYTIIYRIIHDNTR